MEDEKQELTLGSSQYQIEGIDDPQGDDEQIESTVRYSITSYGADMPVDGIVSRLQREDVFIPDHFSKSLWAVGSKLECYKMEDEKQELTLGSSQYQIEGIDDPQGDDEQIESTVRYSITSYGADMPVDGIVSRLQREDVFIPDFQRKFVWSTTQASRFIESLLLGLPVPGIFLFKEPDTRKLMVVDGQQRLQTLVFFSDGDIDGKEFRLVGVSSEFQGKTFKSLSETDRINFNDSIIHATIFQQDVPSNDKSSIYEIFERLNTGGTALHPQEIRSSIYRGRLNDLLLDLAKNPHWRKIYGKSSNRKKDEEIILRFFALYDSLDSYKRPMKQFLHNFMADNQNPNEEKLKQLQRKFAQTVEIVSNALEPNALRPERNLNVSVVDSVFVGLAHRLDRGEIKNTASLKTAHDDLLGKLRDEELYTSGTTNQDRVKKRISIARQVYGSVE